MPRLTGFDHAARGHRFAAVQRVMGILLMVFSVTMLPPIGVDLLYGEGVARAFLVGLGIALTTGAIVWWPVRRIRADLKTRDGFLITVLFWGVLGLFGAIPLLLSGQQVWTTFTEAAFESVSGLTTTGATVVASGLDNLPHALNFYRVQLHWLGGMGIIVLAVAILPMLGVGGMQLYRAEMPGPMKESKLTPRITETARALWYIYMVLTVSCMLVYWWLGMTPFDAICHAMSTVATGGFSTHDASIGYFNSLPIELAAMFFMVMGATNFALHFTAFRNVDPRAYFRDNEFIGMLSVIVIFGVLVCVPLILADTYPDAGTAIRKGMFTLVAFGTNAGFAIADPTPWPYYVPLLIVLAGFMTGCAGSTAGGVKVVRLILFVKQAFRELRRLVHPSAELVIKLDKKVVPNEVVYAIGGFFSVYIGMTVFLTFVMMTTGMEATVAFSAVAASINNEGPGLGPINAHAAGVTDFGKWVMMLAMLMGRLEVFTFLVILTPAFWKR